MTKKAAQGFTITVIVIIVLSAAAYFILFPPKGTYHIDRYIPREQQDSLLVNVVTLMGVKPRYADHQTRMEPRYRQFYIEQSRNYYFYRYYVDDNGLHFFYMIRPARHPLGNRRAIGGSFRLGDDLELLDYREEFVTQVLEEERLRELADVLFPALIAGDLQQHLSNKLIIEWPDDRLRYDLQKREWRYDVEL